jgi:5'-nucleotidase
MPRPTVLLTNDDGYGAAGLLALAEALSKVAQVVVLAPETEQSACSHSLTLHRALRLRSFGQDWHALDGTPADCVYVALFAGDRLLPSRPDIVMSGINRGLNLGFDVYYSGTVAGAREAAIRGVPAVAVSADAATDLGAAARMCARILVATLRVAKRRTVPPLLNVNFPPGRRWKLRATTIGRRIYGEGVDFRTDPRGREYLWIGAPGVRHDVEPGTDTEAFDRGEVGVSSLPLLPKPDASHSAAGQLVRLLSRAKKTREER